MNKNIQKMNKNILTNINTIEILMREVPDKANLSEIKRNLGLSQHPVFRKISQLLKIGIIKKTKKYYSLNYSNVKLFPILTLIHNLRYADLMENRFFDDLKEFVEKAEIAIIFGSFARSSERKGSDVDLFLINSRKIDFRKLELFHLNKLTISPIYSTADEFIDMLKEKKKITRDLIREGIIIHGVEKFYKIVFETYKNEY